MEKRLTKKQKVKELLDDIMDYKPKKKITLKPEVYQELYNEFKDKIESGKIRLEINLHRRVN